MRKSHESVSHAAIRFGKTPDARINESMDSSSDGPAVSFIVDSSRKPGEGGGACYRLHELIEMSRVKSFRLPPSVNQLLHLYAPYCFLPIHARRRKRTMAICHLAQTLDGRIATVSGDSEWIGNQDNRVHAHRMRALCDAVLIGSGTLKEDAPALTVRHVNGKNPRRIVVGSSVKNVDSLLEANPDPVWVIGTPEGWGDEKVETVTLEHTDGYIPPFRILEHLCERGIYTVYIEGGSSTASRFFQENAVDILQLHMSPLVLGSGISSFSLGEVERLAQARRFRFHKYVPMGDGVMFTGELNT